jgi:hypothetical protein
MPKYNVSVSFTLETEIEVDLGYRAFDSGEAEDFSDDSYFSTQSVEADGGNLTFVVEASSEEEAEEKATEVLSEGVEVEDGNGLTWLVVGVSYDIEVIEIPMDLSRARLLIEEFISSMEGMDEDLKEAFSFLLDLVGTTPTLAARDAEIRRLQGEVERLGTLVTTLQVAEARSEAPAA